MRKGIQGVMLSLLLIVVTATGCLAVDVQALFTRANQGDPQAQFEIGLMSLDSGDLDENVTDALIAFSFATQSGRPDILRKVNRELDGLVQRKTRFNAEGFMYLGMIYSDIGKLETSVTSYKQSIRLNPKEKMIYILLGDVQINKLRDYCGVIETSLAGCRQGFNDLCSHYQQAKLQNSADCENQKKLKMLKRVPTMDDFK